MNTPTLTLDERVAIHTAQLHEIRAFIYKDNEGTRKSMLAHCVESENIISDFQSALKQRNDVLEAIVEYAEEIRKRSNDTYVYSLAGSIQCHAEALKSIENALRGSECKDCGGINCICDQYEDQRVPEGC